ncbi:MAG TPA: hypothetical protein DIW43_09010 [Spongiibacteraceae bacterium]|mgnify:CR=1 FL=1|nr:hypothetical protein [Spongiibacteraceae bacterium]HCS27583.1 hypothetical protein [Spongiibacteraceae bacterium]|tara:strand:- start:1019 stop:2719 length:1701 start_codon:yes stop_codon:yes gene_type:complete
MKQWIRWWGLGVFVAIAALWILCIDWVVENSIEFAGTQAVGAKVELDSAELSFSKGVLTLNRLQVTNPDQPMQNLFESARIHLSLDTLALFRRQFISDEADIEGLQLYTERSSSGAIDGRFFNFAGEGGKGREAAIDLASKLNIPDVGELASAEEERLKAEIAAMQNEVADIQKGWEQRIQQLPSKEQIAEYQRRWDKLEGENAFVKLKGAKELRDDIDDDLDAIKSLDEQIKTDKERIARLTEQAKTLPSREADRLLASVGLDQGFDGMIRHIVGDEAIDMINQGLSLYKTAAKQMSEQQAASEDEAPKPLRGTGELVRFAEEQPLPNFLIKQAKVNGSMPVAGQTISFNGVIKDITSEQHIWGRPMTLKADGGSDKGASLTLDGLFDHRSANALDTLNFDLRQLALSALTLSDSEQLPLTLQQGVANIKTNFTLNQNGISANVDSLVKQAQFLVADSAQTKTAQLLRKALASADQFDLKAMINGDLDDPAIKLKSSLDNLIGKALGAEVAAKVAEQKAVLQEKLAAQLQDPTAKLADSGAFLEEYKSKLGSQRDALKDLLKEMR